MGSLINEGGVMGRYGRTVPRSAPLLAAAVVLVVTACGGGDSGPTGGEPAASAPAAETDTVTRADADLVIWADQEQADALKAALTSFGEEEVSTAVQVVPEGELRSAFISANTAGEGPDIVLGPHEWLVGMLQNGAVDPVALSPVDQGRYVPMAMDAVTSNGQLFGLPYAFEALALYRNTDLATAAPATFEDLVTAATSSGVEHPLCLPVGADGDAVSLQGLYSSAGGYLFGTTAEGNHDPNDLGVGQPGSLVAAAKLSELGTSGVLKTSITPENAVPLFSEGRCPFLVAGPDAAGDLAGVPFAVTPVPGLAGLAPARPFTVVHAFYVASKGRSGDLAQQFVLDAVNSPETMRALYDAEPRPPAMTDVLAAVQAAEPAMAGLGQAAVGGQLLPGIRQLPEVLGPLGHAEAAIISGADPADTMRSAGRTISDALQ